ncbi:MAG TPA: shikimate dehydrogenase [Thermoclostridium sp.]|nr:shikimate dehydrogenase [Thermoclostridium sp.]
MKYGLIGEKLSHSYSPEIHKIIFETLGVAGEYNLIELKQEKLRGFLHNAREQGYNGLNVTIPYKLDVIALLDNISEEAKKIGAVNTISFKKEVEGFNTDYYGIKHTFSKCGINVKGKNVLIAGSGGAAKSVITYMLDAGVSKGYVASRNPKNNLSRKKAEDNTVKNESIIPIYYDQIFQYTPFDVVVNATPVGMYPAVGASPLKKEHISGTKFVFDLIYNPNKTQLMKLADQAGIPNVNGLYMLISQAVKAHEIWTGIEYDNDFTNRVYAKILNKDFTV